VNGPNSMLDNILVTFIFRKVYLHCSGFLMNVVLEYHKDKLCDSGSSGLEVSVLASGTGVRGFKPGQSRRIFRAKISLVCLPSEGK
jgi:hypothetical protein